jgi:hypothetical protein
MTRLEGDRENASHANPSEEFGIHPQSFASRLDVDTETRQLAHLGLQKLPQMIGYGFRYIDLFCCVHSLRRID